MTLEHIIIGLLCLYIAELKRVSIKWKSLFLQSAEQTTQFIDLAEKQRKLLIELTDR